MKNVILITGYARAGKDTLAEGIMLSATIPTYHVNFADSLKQACDQYMQILEIGGSGSTKTFRNESFKIKHRNFLVSAGVFARSLDRDVFAFALCRECKRLSKHHDGKDLAIICSDWRYSNEYGIINEILGRDGWNVFTIQINTFGIEAANEEEGKSIGEIVRSFPININYSFKPNSKQAILNEGKSLARQLGI